MQSILTSPGKTRFLFEERFFHPEKLLELCVRQRSWLLKSNQIRLTKFAKESFGSMKFDCFSFQCLMRREITKQAALSEVHFESKMQIEKSKKRAFSISSLFVCVFSDLHNPFRLPAYGVVSANVTQISVIWLRCRFNGLYCECLNKRRSCLNNCSIC